MYMRVTFFNTYSIEKELSLSLEFLELKKWRKATKKIFYDRENDLHEYTFLQAPWDRPQPW